MTLLNWLLLFVLSLLWGGSFFFIKIALSALPIFTIVFLRVFLGSLLLLCFGLITGRTLPKGRKIWKMLIVLGLLNNIFPFCLIVFGQQYISTGFASIMNGTTPFFAVMAAHFFTQDEKISGRKIIGVLLGLIGVLILVGYDALLDGSNKFIGAMAIMGAAIFYALAGIWGKKFKSMNMDPVAISTGQLICSSFLLLPVVLFIDQPWRLIFPGLTVWMALFGIALFSTSLAYILYFKILSSSGATNVLLVTFLIPVSAVLLGIFFLSEEFEIQYLYGMMFIGAGLIFIDGRLIDRIKVKGSGRKGCS